MLVQCPSVVAAFSAMSDDDIVRVAVTGASVEGTEEPLADIDPRSFPSSIEYRKALIAQRAQAQERPRLAIEQKARSLGLQAHSAESLNVVSIEGPVHRVLDFLREVDFQTVVLERPLNLSPLPRPQKLAAR